MLSVVTTSCPSTISKDTPISSACLAAASNLEIPRTDGIITLDKLARDSLAQKPFEEIRQFEGKLSNLATRQWYENQIGQIHKGIDDLPLEEKARTAFELRNELRTQARTLMKDTKARKDLDKTRPMPKFEELIDSKMKRKGITYTEALEDIYITAVKPNPKVSEDVRRNEGKDV